MPFQPQSHKTTLLQDLLPFGAGWTLLVLVLTGFWWHTEYQNQKHLAVARAETAFRLQAAFHLGMMDLRGKASGSGSGETRGLARTFRWQSLDHGDLAGHLTSLHPLAGGGPDEWERKTLEGFTPGLPQFSEVVSQDGQPRLRFMGALRMESACLECHSNAGVAVGGVLGGISLSVPVTSYVGVLAEPSRRIILGAFFLGWAAVLVGMGLAHHRQRRAAALELHAADSQRNSEDRLKEAQRVANMGYWEHDHRSGRIVWSEETFRMFGFAPESTAPSYDTFMDRVHPEDRVRVAEDFQKHLAEHLPYQTEYRILLKDGEIRHILAGGHTNFDEAGTPVRTLGINLDLTDRRKLDEALKAQASAHRILLETSLDGCLEVDEAGKIVNVNDAYLKLSGYSREQLISMEARDLEATDDSGAVRALTSRIRRKGMDRFETWHLRQDGRRIPLQVSVTHLPSQGKFLYFLRDLAGEREARQALAQSEAKFAEAFRMIPEAILITDLSTGCIVDMNPSVEAMSGWKREEILGRSSVELGLWKDPALRNEMVAELLERGESSTRRTLFNLKDGSSRLGEVRSVRFGSSNPPLALTTVRDVTELDRAESSLRASEARFRATFDQASFGMAHLDTGGRILLANACLADFLGIPEADLPGREYLEFLSTDQQDSRRAFLRRMQEGGPATQHRDDRTQRPDGFHVWGRWTTTAIKGPDGNHGGFLEIVEDITELKQRQSVALEAEAITAKGQMAAYVAHEINGPLAGIKSAVELIQSAVPEDHPRRPYVDLVRREVDRIAGIVRSLYELHQVNPSEAKDVAVASVIQDVATLLAPRFRAQGVTLEVDSGERGLRTTLRTDLLRQVLFNLLMNAVEASPQGGKVICEVLQEGGDLEIRIADRGQGIPDDLSEKVWDPGFTTKRNAIQGGLGLGLSTSRRLLESLQGSIRFEAFPGGGTIFFVRIPLKTNPSPEPFR